MPSGIAVSSSPISSKLCLYLLACLFAIFHWQSLQIPKALAFYPGGWRKRGGADGLSRIRQSSQVEFHVETPSSRNVWSHWSVPPWTLASRWKWTSSRDLRSLSRVQLFANPWTAARQASLSFIVSQSLLKLMYIDLMMLSNHLSSDRMWSTEEGNGKPFQSSCLESPKSSMKRQKYDTGRWTMGKNPLKYME